MDSIRDQITQHPPKPSSQPTDQQPQSHTQNNHPKPSSKPPYTITPVRTPEDLNATINLFKSYATSLNIDLGFQDFQTEMSSMPGKYSPSMGGEILLARSSDGVGVGEALGCVALRLLSTNSVRKTCEMKRLYVHPNSRGMGLGFALTRRIIEIAVSLGYEEMRLDTLSSMAAAQRMYEELGFVDVEAYCFNPNEGVRFLGLDLGMYMERNGVGGKEER